MRLRRASDADASFLRELFASARADELALLPSGETRATFIDLQLRAQRAHVHAAHPEAEELIIDEAGEPVGRLVYARSSGEVRLVDLAVLPAARGRGLGSAAVEHVLDEARAVGAPVILHVDIGSPARRLYERLGFTATGEDQVRTRLEWHPPR